MFRHSNIDSYLFTVDHCQRISSIDMDCVLCECVKTSRYYTISGRQLIYPRGFLIRLVPSLLFLDSLLLVFGMVNTCPMCTIGICPCNMHEVRADDMS